jgi:signal transduction histidine kinase/DNA-binding response OmpR family regulator
MNDDETLREALVDLARAREREEGLRLESEGLLRGLQVLIEPGDSVQMFDRLLEVMRGVLHFEQACVLTVRSDGSLEPIATTTDRFHGTNWRAGKLFRRVLDGVPAAAFDVRAISEWQAQPEQAREGVVSALHAPLRGGDSPAMLLCTHSRRGFFGKEHVRLAERFAPLAAQALINAAASELAFHQRLLEKEKQAIEERNRLLKTARDEALAASRAKSEFLANMSHEIRTPLTAIIGFAEAAFANDGDIDRGEALQAVIDNGRHLRSLIDDILDLSKIEADRLEIETIPIDLADLIDRSQRAVRTQAEAKGLAYEVDLVPPLPRTFRSDPTRLQQILYNLCSNAIKFTERGAVRLVISCEPEAQHLSFAVHDDGIGMSAGQQAAVFEPFVQADSSTTRRFGGTGLGLSISRRLAARLGGDIGVVSQPGIGSVFTLTIATGPLDPAVLVHHPRDLQPPHGTPAASAPIPSVRGRILLAEDNPYNQRLVSLYVRKTGAEITIVENGERAVEEALAGSYDLVLMDLQMPVMGGIEAVELLRQACYAGPIAALTAHSMIGDREKVLEAGCNDFLTKPVDWNALFELIGRHLPAAGEAVERDSEAEDEAMRGLAQRFIDELPETLARMQDALAAADWETLRSLAHQLKGVAGSLGYPSLTEIGGRLEGLAGETRQPAAIAVVCDELQREGSRLLSARPAMATSA